MPLISDAIIDEIYCYLDHWFLVKCQRSESQNEDCKTLQLNWDIVAPFLSKDVIELLFLLKIEAPFAGHKVKTTILQKVGDIISSILLRDNNYPLNTKQKAIVDKFPPFDEIKILHDDCVEVRWNNWAESCAKEIKEKII